MDQIHHNQHPVLAFRPEDTKLTNFMFILSLFHLTGKTEERRVNPKQSFVNVTVTSDTLISVFNIDQCEISKLLSEIFG